MTMREWWVEHVWLNERIPSEMFGLAVVVGLLCIFAVATAFAYGVLRF